MRIGNPWKPTEPRDEGSPYQLSCAQFNPFQAGGIISLSFRHNEMPLQLLSCRRGILQHKEHPMSTVESHRWVNVRAPGPCDRKGNCNANLVGGNCAEVLQSEARCIWKILLLPFLDVSGQTAQMFLDLGNCWHQPFCSDQNQTLSQVRCNMCYMKLDHEEPKPRASMQAGSFTRRHDRLPHQCAVERIHLGSCSLDWTCCQRCPGQSRSGRPTDRERHTNDCIWLHLKYSGFVCHPFDLAVSWGCSRPCESALKNPHQTDMSVSPTTF